jgi:hypothetical protein
MSMAWTTSRFSLAYEFLMAAGSLSFGSLFLLDYKINIRKPIQRK